MNKFDSQICTSIEQSKRLLAMINLDQAETAAIRRASQLAYQSTEKARAEQKESYDLILQLIQTGIRFMREEIENQFTNNQTPTICNND